MNAYSVYPCAGGFAVDRDGVRLAVFADKHGAEHFVFAHETFKKSASSGILAAAPSPSIQPAPGESQARR